jgi:hypothetical protein
MRKPFRNRIDRGYGVDGVFDFGTVIDAHHSSPTLFFDVGSDVAAADQNDYVLAHIFFARRKARSATAAFDDAFVFGVMRRSESRISAHEAARSMTCCAIGKVIALGSTPPAVLVESAGRSSLRRASRPQTGLGTGVLRQPTTWVAADSRFKWEPMHQSIRRHRRRRISRPKRASLRIAVTAAGFLRRWFLALDYLRSSL